MKLVARSVRKVEYQGLFEYLRFHWKSNNYFAIEGLEIFHFSIGGFEETGSQNVKRVIDLLKLSSLLIR